MVVALPAGADSAPCQALTALWPSLVSSQPARAVSVQSPAARAWGNPAVIAICGYDAPAPSTLECLSVDGVAPVVHEPVHAVDGQAAQGGRPRFPQAAARDDGRIPPRRRAARVQIPPRAVEDGPGCRPDG